MDTTSLTKMFKKLKVVTLKQVSREHACSIRTVQRQFAKLQVRRSFNKNSRYYTISGIPTFDQNGIWRFQDILFSKYGNLKSTVKNLILSSERGLSGKEIGEITNLSPRSFMHHFRDLGGIFREKHDGVYVYFSDNPTKYAKQCLNRVRARDVEKIGDAAAVKILVEYIKHPDIPIEELSNLLRQKSEYRFSVSEIENFLSFHGLLKKKQDSRQ